MSDSHSNQAFLRRAVEREKDCKYVFFLGDGLNDIQKIKGDFPDRTFICVKGNNDFGSERDTEAYRYLCGHTIVATHGHKQNVRSWHYGLIDLAVSVRADVVFYGHTHRRDFFTDASSGVYMINPGAACSGSYAVVFLEKGTVDVSFRRVTE